MNYTEVILKEQVQADGWFLERPDIPDEMKTAEICKIAVENAALRVSNSRSILYYVPEEQKSLDLCMAAVKKDGSAIRDVPREYLTYELCYPESVWHRDRSSGWEGLCKSQKS